jgi:hypothetical protein
MVIAGVLEFILGNTFPFVVSCGFGMSLFYANWSEGYLTLYFRTGGFWLTMGSTMTPGFGAYAAYSPDQDMPLLGLATPGFLASFGRSSCPYRLYLYSLMTNSNSILLHVHGCLLFHKSHLLCPDKYCQPHRLPLPHYSIFCSRIVILDTSRW